MCIRDRLSTLPGYALLTDTMKTAAMNGALIPDSEGRWPGETDYVPTYDIYFAALKLIPFLQAVSYTHLDVYKRQALDSKSFSTSLFETDTDIKDLVAQWHKDNPSATSSALTSGPGSETSTKDMNALLRSAAK